jgi:hypothetical protein
LAAVAQQPAIMQRPRKVAPVHLAHIVLPLAGMELINMLAIQVVMAELGLAEMLTY